MSAAFDDNFTFIDPALPLCTMQVTLTSNLTAHPSSTGAFWVSAPDPSYRDTYSILSLCLSTLVICIWSAIHLDVPMYRQSATQSLRRHISWKFGALIVPELFLWAALMQFMNARGLCVEAQTYLPTKNQWTGVRKDKDDDEEEEESKALNPVAAGDPSSSFSSKNSLPRLHEFTLTHGFYAAMGGYVFDFINDDGTMDGPAFLPNGRTRITITAAGIGFLMKHAPALVPDLPKTYITDRSEGSSLGKAILLLQVTWFCANCIARLAQHLPLSLLEVTTVAHGVCTLLTYAVWWAKPLNIAEPTLIRGPEARKACALMKMCSMDRYNFLLGLVPFSTQAEMVYITDPNITAERVYPHPHSGAVVVRPFQQYCDGTDFSPNAFIKRNEDLDRRAIYGHSQRRPWFMRRPTSSEDVALASEDVCRWKLASDALRSYGMTRDQVWEEARNVLLDFLTDGSTLHVQAQFGRYALEDWQLIFIFYPALPAIYGCAHFLGWNLQFPTLIEQTLWRIATVTTTFWGVALLCVLLLLALFRFVARCGSFDDLNETTLVAIAHFPMALLYATATSYLLIESLRQVLFLEPAAFELPVWSNYWPHFG